MQLINWLALQPLLAELDTLNARLRESQPAHIVCRSLVEITLHGYPWRGRSDLIPSYHPARTYQPGQWIALPLADPQEYRPTAWQVARVKSAQSTGNSVQGRFQALVLDVDGREVQKTAGIAGATYPEPGLSSYSSEELGWLAGWVSDTYAGALLTTLKKLIRKGRINGQLAGETFLPEQMFALSVERLEPFFDRLSPANRWLSIEEILLGLPDLSELKRDTALALVRSTLKVSPYRSLGGDRWTTAQLFEQLDREVPFGLAPAHAHSIFWTREDRKDLKPFAGRPVPAGALEEPASAGADGPVQLPALSTQHLTQAYFPVGHALDVFAPDAGMVFLQFLGGDHQPYLLDRERGLLKAVHPEVLQTRILEEGLPAGTHLWLVRQGGERYRITPKPLASPRPGPCKRATLRDGKLTIEHSQIQMEYEGEPSLFKVDLRLEDIQALHAEAERNQLSIRGALTSAIQSLCAAGPRKEASRADIFNTAFLLRPCSPQTAAMLLYSLPCFEALAGDHFRFLPHTRGMNIWGGNNRVSRLWEDLVAVCVAPDPVPRQVQPAYVGLEPETPSSFAPAFDEEAPLLEAAGEGEIRESTSLKWAGIESLHLIKHALEALTAPPDEGIMDQPDGKEEPAVLPGSREELESTPAQPLFGEPDPFPYSSMIKVSMEPDPQPVSAIDTRRMAYGLKIPARPLHKRPIHQRLLFCLRVWIDTVSGRSHEPSPR